MQFFVSIFIIIMALFMLREIMPAIALGVIAFVLIKLFTPTPAREVDARAVNPAMVRLVAYEQAGDRVVTANIKNDLKARIYNLRLSCAGGDSFRSTRGFISAGETTAMKFFMRSPGSFKDCAVGYDVDQDDLSRSLGHANSAKAFRDTLVAHNESGRVTIAGEIENFRDMAISGASLICYYTRDGVDAQYPVDVALEIEPMAAGRVDAAFSLVGRTQGGIFCRAVSVSYGGGS